MVAPYRLRQALGRAAEVDTHELRDPGSGGTVKVSPHDLSLLVLSSSGARTLQAAAQVPVRTSVLVCSTVSGASVNGHTLADGESMLFEVTLSSAAARQWVLKDSADAQAAARGMFVATQTALTDTATVTAAQLLTRILDGTPTGAATYTLPTAALLVAAIPGAKVGDSFTFFVNNKSAGANTITVAGGSGGTGDGTLTVAQNVVRSFIVTLTNVTASSEAYSVYGVG